MRGRLLVFALAAGIASLLFIDLCDLLFDCGCRSLWNGAAESCNIHQADGPHCPWCAYRYRGGGLAFASVLLAQAVACFWPRPLGFWSRLAGALVLSTVVGAAVGLLQGLVLGYWK